MNKKPNRSGSGVWNWRRSLPTNYFPLLGVLILMAGILISSACRLSTSVPTPVNTPTITQQATTKAEIAATSTPSNLLPVVDDGKPLPPQVIEQKPAGGQELPVNGDVVVTFDQAMDEQTTGAAWQVVGPDSKPVKGKISWVNPRTLSFKPEQALESNATYMASLSTSATSVEGVSLADTFTLQFETVGELQVSQVFPADGAADVENRAVITAIFNRPVVPLVIAEQQTNLPEPLTISPPVSGHGEWVNTSVYAFRADEPLKGATTYTVVVKAGLADAGNETQLAQDYTWQFTTATPRISSFELSNGTQNPENNLQNVLLDEYFTISFLQPMNQTSTETALSLRSQRGEPVSLITSWNEEDTSVVITPTQRLALGTNYTLALDKSAQAADGGTLRDGLNWNFRTVPPPAVQSTTPANGTIQQNFSGQLQIKFASPMNIDSVKERIVVTPKPEGEIQWYYNDWDWSINAYILQPSTYYQVQLLAGMQDIYGNSITQGRTIRFTTAAYPPQAGLQMPYMPAIFRYGGPESAQEFYATYRNVQTVEFKLFKLSADTFVSLLSGEIQRWDYNPPAGDLVWQHREQSDGKLNERVLKSFRPVTSDGEALSPGFYFLGVDSPQVFHKSPYLDNRLLAVTGANLTLKTTSTEALIWLTDLTSGQPVEGASVVVYDAHFAPIGRGTTDAKGVLYLKDLPVPENPYDPRYAMTEVESSQSTSGQQFAFASSQWGSGISLYDYGIWSSYYSPPNQPTVYAYTDRPIYRPGQPVYFKGIVRLDNDLDYSLPQQSKVVVKIENFKETVYEQELSLSPFGSFDGELMLDQGTALGYYNLSVRFPGTDQTIGGVSFNVAEYRKPEFQVNVTASPDNVLAGENYSVKISAEYYSGGAVGEADVSWTLRSDPYSFTPTGDLVPYSFSDYEIDMGPQTQEQAPGSEVIATGAGKTDENGQLTLTLPADLSQSKTSRQFTLEATVTDLAGNAVSGRALVIAHRSAVYVGVRPQTYIGTAGKEQAFDLVVVDWDGKPVTGQKVNVEIVERRWYSVQEQDASGRIRWTSSVEEIPVATVNDLVTDEKGRTTASFVPPKGGVFRAKATAQDSYGNEARASAFLWVAGEEFIPWRQTNDRSFDLVVDRDSYNPGDTAEILIASPFQGDAYALVTVERGLIHHQEVILLTSNSTIYKLPITADMAPNAYVSVMVVKGVDETNPRPNFKMGVKEIKVDTLEQAVKVEVVPDRTQAGPGEQVRYTVTTSDYQGNPVNAEVSLGLSDLATLSLTSPNSSPILDYFYAHRTLGVWTSVPIGLSIEDYNANIQEMLAEGEGMGSGGGKGEGEFGVIDVREEFPDTAYWDAHVLTGDQGKATVTVTLPDNLTTWRMDARAVTMDTRVGQITQDVISTKPLLVQPQTPRFFVVNDETRLGAAVHNNTDQSLTVNVSLEGTGLTLQSEATQQVEIPARRQAYVTWDASVQNDAQRVDLVFSAEGGGYQDASRPPQGTLDKQGIPVYRYEARETVGTSGQMLTGGTRLEGISLPPSMDVSEGELTIQLAPSLAAGMTDGLTFLEHYPYECVEQIISKFLPNVITTRALKAAGLSDPSLESNLQTQVSTALQRLYNSQNPDGGWGWWVTSNTTENQKSDLLTSAYVVLGLTEAKTTGYTVSDTVLNNALNYLRSQVQPISGLTEPRLLNRQTFVLYVLARAGQADVSHTVQIYDQRQAMHLYARAFLAHTFYIIDPGDPRIKTLLSDFTSAAIVSATGTHWEEEQTDYWNWNTDTRTTAIILEALSQIDPENPLNANGVRWLMSSRTNGHWMGTQETAWTLMALTNWMVASGELQADYRFAVALNGERLGGGTANAETLRQTFDLRVDVTNMLKDQINRLVFARDDGPGNLYYTAHLSVSIPVEKVDTLDQGIVVSRSYYPLDSSGTSFASTPVTQAKRGDLLLARLTVVAPGALHYVIIEDPLPAGLEAIDQSLLTSPQNITPQNYQWNDLMNHGWGWWYFEHVQLRDEKVVLSASYLPAGTYVYTYMVRAGTAGTYRTIPATAQEFYFPEVYGRGAGSLFEVTP